MPANSDCVGFRRRKAVSLASLPALFKTSEPSQWLADAIRSHLKRIKLMSH